jgi:LPXTG-site transpeptidase (sortase) family protein
MFVWDVFPLNQTATITFQTIFVGPSPTVNTANVAWTSLPIDPRANGQPASLSNFNTFANERWYNPRDATQVNDYRATSSATIAVPTRGLPKTGFAPGKVTILPEQPLDRMYTSMGDMWLEIPSLGLKLPVTGVPLTEEGWDLTWLANQAGYLTGTTYPGQVGTTGITAHVTLADGTPGPFRNLDTLLWGDQVILHADGYRYIYEVRESRTVLPKDYSVFKNDGYTWLTLLTCKGYVPWLDTYNYRLAVRAVLLKVEADPLAIPQLAR